MALYECVFIARQDISASQVEGLVDQFSGVVESGGGQVTKKEMWGLRTLAYRIKKNRKGHYALLHIDAPAEAVHEMERGMRLNEDVLRYLTLRMNEIEEGPSVVMQARDRRDERGGRFGRGGGRFGDRERGGRPGRDGGRFGERERGAPRAERDQADGATAASAGDQAEKTPKAEQETSA